MMEKEKLRSLRKLKGYTHKEIADVIATSTSNYSRKESGQVKIFTEEWIKISRFLNVSVEEIYEHEESKPTTQKKASSPYSSGIFLNHDYAESLIRNLQDYIILLKDEISRLKDRKAPQ
jgi:DNA-binding XRE family transcriptional regulator